MSVPSYPASILRFRDFFSISLIPFVFLLATLGIMTGCGSNPSNDGGPQFKGNTSVTLLLSSTANDQLVNYQMSIQSLTLTDQSGKTATLIAIEQPTEFIHLNGVIEPYGMVTIPQGIYASATAKIGGTDFTCITVQGPHDPVPGSLTTSTYAYGYVPDSMVTVNIANPITITGDSMAVKLDLQVSQSASFPSSCYTTEFPAPYTITPTLKLSPMSIAAVPKNSGNGKVMRLVGEIKTIEATGNQFVLYISESQRMGLGVPSPQYNERTATISVNSNTVYHGITAFADLHEGSFINLDGSILADGSITASRISVHDPAALNVMFGAITETNAYAPYLVSFTYGQQGVDYDRSPMAVGLYQYTGSTAFQVADQFDNLGNLPFVPSFTGANIVPGQNMAIYSQHISYAGGGPEEWNPATTMTLLPQTINGTIVGTTANGYLVELAPYDLFPALAVQPGQTNLLTQPDAIDVYVDSNTASLNKNPLTPGSTARFYGVIFNDNGWLKMDCAQVNDGVDVTPVGTSISPKQGDDVPKIRFRMSADRKQYFYTYTKYEKSDAQER